MLKVQTHFCKYKGARIKVKQYGTSDFKTKDKPISKMSNYDLQFWFSYIAQKSFCSPDGATDPTFEMWYVSAI